MLEVYWQQLLSDLFNPQKRLFLGYLLCALIIAVFWLVIVKRDGFISCFCSIFSKKVWWSASSKLDYQLVLINRLLMLLLSPVLISQLAIASALFLALYEWLPQRPLFLVGWSDWSVGFLFTGFYFVLDDFSRFYVHRLMHHYPFLWAFHKTHHSAEVLTPLTVLRTHPVESIVFSLRTALVQGLTISLFIFFIGDRVSLITVLGANVFMFTFNVLGSNLRHSSVALYYPEWLEKIILSPAQHHLHHSKAEHHWNSNYGVALAVWDRWFGSFKYSEKNVELSFGVDEYKEHSLKSAYWQPFQESARSIKFFLIGCLGRAHKMSKADDFSFNKKELKREVV